MKTTASIGAKVRTLAGGVLLASALPGVALAGTDPAAIAAAPPPLAPPMNTPPPPSAAPPYPAPVYDVPNYAAPYGYPPAPYAYPPSAYFAAPRVAVLEAQIGELQTRRDDITFAGPVTAIVGGAVLTIVGVGVASSNVCSTNESGYPTNPSCTDNDDRVTLGVFMVGLGIVGVGVGTLSTIIRGAKRRHLARQIEARQLEVNALRGFAPRVDFKPTPSGGGTFSLAFDF